MVTTKPNQAAQLPSYNYRLTTNGPTSTPPVKSSTAQPALTGH